jgi:hypothetical protein
VDYSPTVRFYHRYDQIDHESNYHYSLSPLAQKNRNLFDAETAVSQIIHGVTSADTEDDGGSFRSAVTGLFRLS